MKNFIKNMFRLREWSDFDRTKRNTKYLETLFYYLLHPSELKNRPTRKFEKVIDKYNLKDSDLEQRDNIFKRYTLLFLLITIGIWLYLAFSLVHGKYWICITIFCISLVPLSLAFRFHFYHRVIRAKRLNYSINDWVKGNK